MEEQCNQHEWMRRDIFNSPTNGRIQLRPHSYQTQEGTKLMPEASTNHARPRWRGSGRRDALFQLFCQRCNVRVSRMLIKPNASSVAAMAAMAAIHLDSLEVLVEWRSLQLMHHVHHDRPARSQTPDDWNFASMEHSTRVAARRRRDGSLESPSRVG